MGRAFRRKCLKISKNYWESSHRVNWIYKEINAKRIKRD